MSTEDLKQQVHTFIIKETNFLRNKDKMTDDELRNFVDNAIMQLCKEQDIVPTVEQRQKIIRDLVSAVVSMGALQPLMDDPTVTEIMVNGAEKVYVQRAGKMILTDVKFESNQSLSHTIQKILAGSGTSKRVDESSPFADLSLPD
ncbi:MAG: Flp pilus assembly complex ATPase component TadA, partial [Candidatus Omnitrophica bacterium]|nr:Flp pilus assembly complex ATPase component TadA [Candidatus Omnitrophota bacterium]